MHARVRAHACTCRRCRLAHVILTLSLRPIKICTHAHNTRTGSSCEFIDTQDRNAPTHTRRGVIGTRERNQESVMCSSSSMPRRDVIYITIHISIHLPLSLSIFLSLFYSSLIPLTPPLPPYLDPHLSPGPSPDLIWLEQLMAAIGNHEQVP